MPKYTILISIPIDVSRFRKSTGSPMIITRIRQNNSSLTFLTKQLRFSSLICFLLYDLSYDIESSKFFDLVFSFLRIDLLFATSDWNRSNLLR